MGKQQNHFQLGAAGLLTGALIVSAVAIGVTSAQEMHMGSYPMHMGDSYPMHMGGSYPMHMGDSYPMHMGDSYPMHMDSQPSGSYTPTSGSPTPPDYHPPEPTGIAPPLPTGTQPTQPFPEGVRPPGEIPPPPDFAKCGPPPFCPFGHKPLTAPTQAGQCPSFECNPPSPGFEKFGEGRGPQPSFTYPGLKPPVFPSGAGTGEGAPTVPPFAPFADDPLYKKFAEQTQTRYKDFQFNPEEIEKKQKEFQKQFKGRELQQRGRELARDGAQLEREAQQIKAQIERIGKRSGVYCPALSDYSAALTTIETAISQWKAAKTPEEVAAALALRDQIYGSPDDPTISGVMQKLRGYFDHKSGEFTPGLDQQIRNCEAAGHSFRELERMIQELERMLAQAQKKGLDITEGEALLAELRGYKDNPPAGWFDPPDFNKCPFGGGPPGFGGPGGFGLGAEFGGFSVPKEYKHQFEEGFEKYKEQFKGQFEGFQGNAGSSLVAQAGFPGPGFVGEDYEPSEEELACMPGFARVMMQVGRKFEKLMQQLHEGFFTSDIFAQIDQIVKMAPQMKGKVPAACYEKGLAILEQGKAAKEAGNVEAARLVVEQMHRLGGSPLCRGRGQFVDVDVLGEENLYALIEKKVEKRVQEELKNRMESFFEKHGEELKLLASLNSKLANALISLFTFDISERAQKHVKEFAESPQSVQEAVLAPIQEYTETIHDQLEQLPEDIRKALEELFQKHIDEIVQVAPPETVMETLRQAVDAALMEVRATDDPKKAREILQEHIEAAKAALEAVTPEQRIKAGQTNYRDVSGDWVNASKQWYFSEVAKGAQSRPDLAGGEVVLLQGTKAGEAQPEKVLNNAEMIVITVRAAGLEDEAKELGIATLPSGISSGGADYAAPYATVLDEALREAGTSLAAVLDNDTLSASASRVDVAEVIAHIGNLEAEAGVKVPEDATNLAEAEYDAVAAVVDAGIMTGRETATGEVSFAPDSTLLKAEAVAAFGRLLDYAQVAGAAEFHGVARGGSEPNIRGGSEPNRLGGSGLNRRGGSEPN